MRDLKTLFTLENRVAVVTGGAGLLGLQHSRAIASVGGIPILADVSEERARTAASAVSQEFGVPARGVAMDVTSAESIRRVCDSVRVEFGKIDILINNAANNPKFEVRSDKNFTRFEHFPMAQWDTDLDIGLKGAFLCCQIIGSAMAERGYGTIVNVASDLALIAPDQRIYRQDDLPADLQPAKPVTYSVVKTALVGLTRYLATYWSECGVRVNALSPGGVANGQPDNFVMKLRQLIPMARMADVDEYCGAIVFLCSDASSYMTGTNLVVDGGRTCW